jgi:uncharacterized Zn finger protein
MRKYTLVLQNVRTMELIMAKAKSRKSNRPSTASRLVGDAGNSSDNPNAVSTPTPRVKSRRTSSQWNQLIESHIRSKSREELADLLWSLVKRFPELRDEFQERLLLAEGDAGRLVDEAWSEMRSVTEEIGWRNHWEDDGYIPDYTRLQHRLERLVEMGHCNQVAELGRELIRRGIQQIEQSHDEGETGMALADSLKIVFSAVKRSDMPAADKILYAIDADLLDGYGMVDAATPIILGARWKRADWSTVADRLNERLPKAPQNNDDEFLRCYQRDNMSNWLLQALSKAGRKDELLAVYETEARATGSYQRLVNYLLEQDRLDEAYHWACEGIEKTPDAWAGIHLSLLKSLCDVARRRRQWDVVAAHAAMEFVTGPCVRNLDDLLAAAKKAGCDQTVHTMAQAFLETGVSPIRATSSRQDKRSWSIDPAWPLPMPGYFARLRHQSDAANARPRPHYDVLIDLAIDRKRPDQVLHWYDRMVADHPQPTHGWTRSDHNDRVAEAVAKSHPERALDIYRERVERNLAQTGVSAYETVASYLRKMKPLMKSLDRAADWDQLLQDIRLQYRNRPRFIEILDRLKGKASLATRKTRR